MAKLTITITGKVRSAWSVLTALWEQGPAVARLVSDKLPASLREGEGPSTIMAQIEALGQLLQSALDLMVELDTLTVDENLQRAALLKDRDDMIVFLGQRLTGLRGIVAGHYLEPDLERLGLDGRNEREAIAVLRQSEQICKRLREEEDLEGVLGEALFEPRLDPVPYGLQIESTNGELRDLFEGHQRARRRVDTLLARKKEAVKDYDTTFVRVARQFEDLCRLAGLDDLADKVRPSLSHKGETAIPPTGGEAPTSPAGESEVTGESGSPEEAAASDTAPEESAPEESAPDPEPGSDVGVDAGHEVSRA